VAALVALATRLTVDERKIALRWAEMQAAALDILPDRLGSDRFLSEDPACADPPPASLRL